MAATEPLTRPLFPPLITGRSTVGFDDPWDRAVKGAAAGDLGAGDLLYSNDPDVCRMVLILEPEVPRARCREMVPLLMAAFSDAAGSVIPSEIGVTFTWPSTIRLNGAAVGHVRCALDEQDDHAWMALGLTIQMAPLPGENPGETPDLTSFADEGCGEVTTLDLIESTSRHLMHWMHRWETDGFAPIHRHWWDRRDEKMPKAAGIPGKITGMDENGNAILKGPVPGMTIAEAMS
ncbi:MAG: biotin/lipoate--protein ligase family protein [Pseudomonadota bacterium]